jgi:dihydrofolate reductase
MMNNLIDEFIISIIPVLLGDGIKLFKDGRLMNELKLVTSKQFVSGLTQLHYKLANN